MSYVDALFDRDSDRIHVVERVEAQADHVELTTILETVGRTL